MKSSVGLNGREGIFRKVPWSKWRNRIVIPLVAAMAATGFRMTVAADQQAWLGSGRVCKGQIVGTDATTLAFESATEGDAPRKEIFPLASIRQIQFTVPLRWLHGARPLRRLELRGGERWHAGLESIDGHHVNVSNADFSTTAVPRAAVAGVFQPSGARIVVYEDFENRPVLFENAHLSPDRHRSGRTSLVCRRGDGPASLTVPASIDSGRVELSFYDTGEIAPRDWLLEFEFGSADRAIQFRFVPGWSGSDYRCVRSDGAPIGAQPLARSNGWHQFTLLFDSKRVTALVDGKVVSSAAGIGRNRPLRVVRADVVTSGKESARAKGITAAETSAIEGYLDDLQVFDEMEFARAPSNTQTGDLLWLADGDELFGSVDTADPRGVSISGRFGRQRVAWSEINGLIFPAGGGPAGTPIEGVIAAIELAPGLGGAAVPGDRIVAALQSAPESDLVAVHPCLGTIRIPLGEIARIIPHFRGELRLVDPGLHHLGNEIREEFSAKLAEGPRLEREFALPTVPKGHVFVSLLAADVEPLRSPNERFRRQLAAGRLTTDLIVNGRRVADINRYVSWRALPENPERLRIAVPVSLLKKGVNTLRFEQHPAEDDPDEFDDCEISRLAIEIEAVTR